MKYSTQQKLYTLAKKINNFILNKKWYTFRKSYQKKLLKKLTLSYNKIKDITTKPQLLKKLGFAAILLINSNHINAQLGSPQLNAFGITDSTCTGHQLVDLDNDGDLDLFLSRPYGNALYYQNTGTDSLANFSTSPTQPLGAFIPHDYTFVDIDKDGDLDLFASKEYGAGPYFYENTGTINNPTFGVPQLNAFGIADSTCTGHQLVDLDNDGDLDLFLSRPYGNALYYQNTGTDSLANFSTSPTQPLGSFIPHDYTFVDIDNDGDLDLFASKEYGAGPYFYENTGTINNPTFGVPQLNAFGIADSTCTGHQLVDLDNDGDLDLFLSVPYGNALYYQNTGTDSLANFSTSPTQPLGSFIPHDYTFVDIDNDGDLDLFASKEYGAGPYFYKNALLIGVSSLKNKTIGIRIFPNPSSDILYIDQKDNQSTDVQIFNTLGQPVLTTSINQKVSSINIEHLPQGTYIFSSSTNQKPNPVYTFIKK